MSIRRAVVGEERRPIRLAWLAALALGVFVPARSAAQTWTSLTAAQLSREFTPYDDVLPSRVAAVWETRRISVLAKSDPSSPELIQLALKWKRYDEALAAVRALATAPPDRLPQGLDALARIDTSLDRNPPDTVRFLLALEPIAARVPSLPREIAARVILNLWNLENKLGRPLRNSVSDRWNDYQDTAVWQSLNARQVVGAVDQIRDADARVAELDRIAAAAPGTITAATALEKKASDLGQNASWLFPKGQDPTGRLLSVIAIVNELESGGYPAASIDDAVPDLVTHAYLFDTTHVSSDGARRLVSAYRGFLRSHSSLTQHDNFCDSSTFYWITRTVAPLLRPDDPGSGVETIFEEDLIPAARNADELKLCLDRFEVTAADQQFRPDTPQRLRGVQLLETLASSASDMARPALAILASKAFTEGDGALAASLLDEYITRYPDAPWTWVAAMKRARLTSERGTPEATAAAYLDVAHRYRDQPLAPVLGAFFAGWYDEEAGAIPDALDAYRQAQRNWDPAHGQFYDFPVRFPRSTSNAGPPSRIARADLDRLVARLAVDLREPGGADLARAQRLLRNNRYEEAADAFRAFLGAHPSSAEAVDARRDMHRAQLIHATYLGNVFRAEHDDAACFAILDALDREPYDFYVAAAGLARSSILHRQDHDEEAQRVASSTVERLYTWRQTQIARVGLDPVEADLAQIRSELLRPGAQIQEVDGQQSEPLTWPPRHGVFAEMAPEIAVTLGGQTTTRTVWQTYAAVPNAIPITREEAEVFLYIALAGNANPNAFPRTSLDGIDELLFWRSVLGDAGGGIGNVVFLNAARTLATADLLGKTVRIEKFAGHWRIVRVVGILPIT